MHVSDAIAFVCFKCAIVWTNIMKLKKNNKTVGFTCSIYETSSSILLVSSSFVTENLFIFIAIDAV